MLFDLLNILRIDRAFSLAYKKKDNEALKMCNRCYDLLLDSKLKFSPSVIEGLLLRAFLMLEKEDRAEVRKSLTLYFRCIKTVKYFNKAETAYMNRYALSILWISRGSQDNSCLIKMRNIFSKDLGLIRPTVLARFASPDL